MRRQSSGSKPPKNPKKKAKPSPATMPVTPEVEVPPKASASAALDPKDVINVDDLPEEPAVESGKGASPSQPPPEEPAVTSTEAPAKDVEKKLLLSGATGTPQTHTHHFPTLKKIPLSQRHVEMTNLMNEVWGNPETEQQARAPGNTSPQALV
jgi:hypothetical protein